MCISGSLCSRDGLDTPQVASERTVLKLEDMRLDLAGCLKLSMSQVSGDMLLQHLQVKQSNEVLCSQLHKMQQQPGSRLQHHSLHYQAGAPRQGLPEKDAGWNSIT